MIKEREFEKTEMARMEARYVGVAVKATDKSGGASEEELIEMKKKLSDVETELLNVHIQLKEKNEVCCSC